MKKRFLVMAMAGLALAGCVSEDVSDVKQKDEKVKITFDKPLLYNNVNSRANVVGEIGTNLLTKNYPTNENFVIYAVDYDDDITFPGWENAAEYGFNGDAISFIPGIDGWVPLTKDNPETTEVNEGGNYYYWPTDRKMAFAAYSPAELDITPSPTITYNNEGLTIENFVIQADADNQYDLLFSERTVDKTAAQMSHGASDYSGISIRFQHALSSIRFSLMNETQVDVNLKKITLWGTQYKGTFEEKIEQIEGELGKYVIGDNVNPTWTNTNETVTPENAYVAFEGNIDFPYPNASYVKDITDFENKPVADGGYGEDNDCNQLLLLPQSLSNHKIYLRVDYSVAGHDTYKEVELNNRSCIDNPLTTENEAKPITSWEMGKRYTYRIVYSSETEQKDMIYFAPSTEAFDDVSVIIVTL